jgi:hypothetical protein
MIQTLPWSDPTFGLDQKRIGKYPLNILELSDSSLK